MGKINIKTEIPGPLSNKALEERQEEIGRGISTAYPILVEKAEGAIIQDADGNEFIDLAAGISSLNVGHSPKPVVNAIREQLDKFINPIFNVTMHQPYID